MNKNWITAAAVAVVMVAFLAIAVVIADGVRGTTAVGATGDNVLFCTPTPTPFNPNAPTARVTRTPRATSGGFGVQLLPSCDTPTPTPSPTPSPTPCVDSVGDVRIAGICTATATPAPTPTKTPRVTRTPAAH
jgi:hypothetical protein